MNPDLIEAAVALLGLFVTGFAAGFLIQALRRFLEQI